MSSIMPKLNHIAQCYLIKVFWAFKYFSKHWIHNYLASIHERKYNCIWNHCVIAWAPYDLSDIPGDDSSKVSWWSKQPQDLLPYGVFIWHCRSLFIVLPVCSYGPGFIFWSVDLMVLKRHHLFDMCTTVAQNIIEQNQFRCFWEQLNKWIWSVEKKI
jgi:hypothetical protein